MDKETDKEKEMKSALNRFCNEFLCRECIFCDKENERCTISHLLL